MSTANSSTTQRSHNLEGITKVCSFLKACNTYFIATVEGNQPRVRPFGTIEIIEGKLYIQSGHSKCFAKQLLSNPLVEISAFNGSEWIRVAGKLVNDDRVEVKKTMLDAYPELRGMYNENDSNTAVYYITEATATISSFAAPPEIIEF